MAAGVAGTLGAGFLYEAGGYDPIFSLLAVLVALSLAGVWLFVDPDTSTVRGFAFTELALNRRIRVMASFRAPYAFAVTLVRNWVSIYVGVSVARGGLGYRAFIVDLVVAAEKFTNMLLQPMTGRLSDRHGREPFIALGGGLYGAIALLIPLAPAIGSGRGLPTAYPLLGSLSPAFFPVLVLNALLWAADGIREPASMTLFADEGIASSCDARWSRSASPVQYHRRGSRRPEGPAPTGIRPDRTSYCGRVAADFDPVVLRIDAGCPRALLTIGPNP